MSRRNSRTIYVGNLPGDIREREVEDLFYKYGRIVDIDLKIPPRPPGYAFVEFEDPHDAEDAIYGRDGYDYDGHRLRLTVEEALRLLIDQATIAVVDAVVHLDVLITALWSLDYLRQHHGKISRIICGELVMSVSLMFTVRLEQLLE